MNDQYPPSATSRPARLVPEIGLDVSPPASLNDPEGMSIWLRDHGVEEVECVTPDFAGVGRGKVMPTSKRKRPPSGEGGRLVEPGLIRAGR